MKLRFRSTLLLLTTLLATMASLHSVDTDAGTKYKPQLAPIFTAGETFTYHATVEYHDLMRITDSTKKAHTDANGDSKTVRTDKEREKAQTQYSAELSADAALARAVFKNGSLEEAEFHIRHCELIDEKGNTVQLLPAGAIVGARKQADGQVAFAVNGRTPDHELAEHLSVLITLGDEHATANDFLGAPGPVPVGATWAVNEKAMLNSDLPRIFPGVDRLAGSVALRSAKPDGSGAVQTTVTGTYRLGDVRPPFPSDVEPNPSDVRFEVLVTAPVAPGPGKYDVQTSVLIHHTGHTGDIQFGLSETDIEVGFTIDQEAEYLIGGVVASASGLASAPAVPELPPLPPGMSSAPILRPDGPTFRPHPQAAPAAANVPTAPRPSAPPAQPIAPPALLVPNDSPFSNAQDLPSTPANAK
jgi:hypothetical protein